ncbi:N-acetylglucosaminyl-diphospho-decaprenol L-rhamnosyltransferase [Anaerolineae bacterium]|nr:N-acetylglucosaminyl-diphospho-decaprenol L-rhamnosyltransferase [Anaerolineae bacterium]
MAEQLTQTPTQSTQPQTNVPDLSVVIVCMNNKRYLEPCLQSLYDAGLAHRFDVVVTDNGSTDGTQAMLREKFPAVQVIQNDRNVGLSRASNQGIQATRGRYVLLLNDDTLVNRTSLEAMIEYLDRHPKAGGVGGRLLNPDGSFQAAGNKFPSLVEEFLIATRLGNLIWRNYPDRGYPAKETVVDWIGSACVLLRRAALDQVGLLDETYFIYGDEADLQYRLKRAGWQVVYSPNVTTIHYGGRSMNRWRRRRMVYRGKMLFFKKNYGSLQAGVLRIVLGVLSLLKLAVWGVAFILPPWRERARQELSSNMDVVKLCWNLNQSA